MLKNEVSTGSGSDRVRLERNRPGCLAVLATNAGLLAIAILASSRPSLREKLHEFRAEQEKKIRETTLD